jgi:hypothetical protein
VDDAPPVITSTRWTAAEGIELMSTTPVPLTGMPRRPSISTRFRFDPSWRRLTVEMPIVLFALAWKSPVLNWVSAGVNCGSLLRLASRLIWLLSSSSSASTVTIGLVAT